MKKCRKIALLVSMIICANVLIGQKTAAGSKPVFPKWVAGKGFWVVETNIHTPESAVVRFYTDEQRLIYTEKIDGVVLNFRKRRTLVKLKRLLDKVINEWEKNGFVKEPDNRGMGYLSVL